MSLKHNLPMHWPLAVGVVLFLPAVWKYWSLTQWDAHAVSMALAAFGFVLGRARLRWASPRG